MSSEGECCWICLDGDNAPGSSGLFAPCSCPRVVHRECLARWQLRRLAHQEGTHCRFCSQRLPDWTEALAPPPSPASTAAPPSSTGNPCCSPFGTTTNNKRPSSLNSLSPSQQSSPAPSTDGAASDSPAAGSSVSSRALSPFATSGPGTFGSDDGSSASSAVAVVSIHVGGAVYPVLLPPGEQGRLLFKQQVEGITGVPFSDETCEVSFCCRDPFGAADEQPSTIVLDGFKQFDAAMRCAMISSARSAGSITSSSSGGGTSRSVSGGTTPPPSPANSSDGGSPRWRGRPAAVGIASAVFAGRLAALRAAWRRGCGALVSVIPACFTPGVGDRAST